MISGNKILALVPARSGSKGLKNKNVRSLLGKPLLAWPIEAASGSKYIDKIIISTDSPEYANIAKTYGAEAPFLRPSKLALDSSTSIEVLLHAIDELEASGETHDIVVLLEPTSPMTESSDIDSALEILLASPNMTAAVGIAAMETQHPAFAVRYHQSSGRIEPLLGGQFGSLPRRQELEPVFTLDGSFYISTTNALRKHHSFCHSQTIGIPTERHHALEVDDLIDFICIEAILKYRAKNTLPKGTKIYEEM